MEAFSPHLIKPPMEPVEGDMEDDGLFDDLVQQIALLMIDDDEKLQMTQDDSSVKHDSYLNLQNQVLLKPTSFSFCTSRSRHEFGRSMHYDARSPEGFKWEILHAADRAVRIPFSGARLCRAAYPAIHDNALLKPRNSFPIGPAFSNFSDGGGEAPVLFPVREVSYPWNFRGKLARREGSGTGVFIPRSCKLSYMKDEQQAGLPYVNSAASLLQRGQNLRSHQKIHPQNLRMPASNRCFKGNGLDEWCTY